MRLGLSSLDPKIPNLSNLAGFSVSRTMTCTKHVSVPKDLPSDRGKTMIKLSRL
jgi:hypothetical protein